MQPVCGPVVNQTAEVPPTAEPLPAGPPSEPGARTVEPGPPEPVEPSPPAPPSEPATESSRLRVQGAKRRRRVDRFEQVHQRHRQGQSERRIARELGMSRKTVRRYLRRRSCPDWNPGRPRRSTVEAHRDWIDARLAEGLTNVAELPRHLAERGFQGYWPCSTTEATGSGTDESGIGHPAGIAVRAG
ncbi:MAG TPA: helix-turn-helix domain-containing protein [Isosphaeraceae bacterium]|nr:helix-turn-helix domain-containing protein [Isosphaeraceae bacterium]